MILRYGIISDVKKGFAKVNFEEENLVSDWMPVLVRKSLSDKESWQLEPNEHVVCVMDHECVTGVILGAICNEIDTPDPGEGKGKYRKLFSDGTFIQYDKNSGELTVDVKGNLNAKATGDAVIDITGSLEAKAGPKASIEAVEVEVKATAAAKIQATVINLQGNVVVSGSLSAASISTTGGGAITSSGNIETTGELKGATVKAGAIDLATHKHSGVQTGGGSTGAPIS